MSFGGDSANSFVMHGEKGPEDITRIDAKKDLGIWLSPNLSFSLHLEKSAQKALAVLLMIRRTFSRITLTDFQILYGAYVRTLLEYANPVFYTHERRERQLLNDKNKTDPGNLGESLDPVYQSVNPVFVIFEKKDDAERLLTSNDAASYKGNDMVRKYREDYLKEKKEEKDARARARAEKNAASEASQRDYVTSRMVAGALLELCGLPKVCKENQEASANTNGKPVNDEEAEHLPNLDAEQTGQPDDRDNDNPGALTIIALKQWLSEKLGPDYPIAWIDVEPAAGKGLVRFKATNTAEPALNKLRCAFGDQPIVYANSEITGRVLSGDEEFSHWKTIIAAQQQKAQKRRGGRGGGRGGGANKRRRMN
ncbi:lupus La protein [Clonorchis sinensis]|uniref:Lupus La protein n=1 Tax=Clonorchis sinensis TaxID=79923 RepID=G7YR83_CLOSI|nr:lupus La protein [Clonorchis sinensis]